MFMQKQQELDKQRVQQQMRENRQEIRQQLSQEAQHQRNREAEHPINREAQMLLNQQVQADFPPAHADVAAAGEAIQQMAPARKSYKAKRAEKRHAEEARKHCPVGDIVTYDIKHQLEGYYKQNNTLFNRNFPFLGINPETNAKMHDMSKNLSGVDRRVLQIFSHTFRTGEAAVSADEKYQREGQAFYDAFCSTDYVRRAPYLQRMVEEVLSYNLKEDMFSDKNMRSNTAEYKSMADRIVYMENVMNDKNNAFFFDTPLCPVKKEVLKKALDIAAPMVSLFKVECQKRGIEPDLEDVPYISEDAAFMGISITAEIYAADYKGTPGEYQSLKESIKSEETQKPTPEMYQQIRSFIEGDVQKLLDCDVEKLNALSGEELRKLYSISLGVDKCLTLEHPIIQFRTLKDDLIGQRRLEYEYKTTVLKGLVEKADGFKRQGKETMEAAATRYRDRLTPKTTEFKEFFESLLGIDLNDRVCFIPSKFAAVTKEFNAIPAEKRAGKIAEAGKITKEIKELQGEGKIAEAKKIAEDKKQLLREGKIAGVMERLQSRAYYTLAYSQEQLKDMKMPSDIGEALFRSFGNFLTSEAAQTLLTPEQFEQMLFNLGAGAGLTSDLSEYEEQMKQAIEKKDVEKQQELEIKKKDTEEERDEAIKMNNAGLDTLRKVLTAHYGMLERKYGDSLERLTIKELMEHYEDIGKDLTNGQQDLNMATKFPGFIRKDNLDDERLFNQIQYYRRCSYAIASLIPWLIQDSIPEPNSGERLEISDEGIQKFIGALMVADKEKEAVAAREYLIKNNSGFQHPMDWSQKVENPADGN